MAMAEEFGLPLWKVVGVLAAISPGNEYGRNVEETRDFIDAYTHGKELPVVGVYGKMNMEKARRILEGALPLEVFPVKTSPKVRAFFACILFPYDCLEVCVDRHAKAVACNLPSERTGAASDDKKSVVRPGEYGELAKAYRAVAGTLGLLPHQLQAVCWVAWKDKDELQ